MTCWIGNASVNHKYILGFIPAANMYEAWLEQIKKCCRGSYFQTSRLVQFTYQEVLKLQMKTFVLLNDKDSKKTFREEETDLSNANYL